MGAAPHLSTVALILKATCLDDCCGVFRTFYFSEILRKRQVRNANSAQHLREITSEKRASALKIHICINFALLVVMIKRVII